MLYIANLNFEQVIKQPALMLGHKDNKRGGEGDGAVGHLQQRELPEQEDERRHEQLLPGQLHGRPVQVPVRELRVELQRCLFKAGNIGMYNRMSAGMFHQIGSMSYRVPVKSSTRINQSERNNLKLLISVVKKEHWAMQEIPAEFRSKIQLDWELSTGHIVSKEKQFVALVLF